MPLELGSLRKSIDALGTSLDVAHDKSISGSTALRDTIRAGVVQNFEVAYELCWKFVQRWLRINLSPEDADRPRTRRELFRIAARYGLISDVEAWFAYGDARNQTSHTYDERQAAAVFAVAERFAVDARNLLERLESLND